MNKSERLFEACGQVIYFAPFCHPLFLLINQTMWHSTVEQIGTDLSNYQLACFAELVLYLYLRCLLSQLSPRKSVTVFLPHANQAADVRPITCGDYVLAHKSSAAPPYSFT